MTRHMLRLFVFLCIVAKAQVRGGVPLIYMMAGFQATNAEMGMSGGLNHKDLRCWPPEGVLLQPNVEHIAHNVYPSLSFLSDLPRHTSLVSFCQFSWHRAQKQKHSRDGPNRYCNPIEDTQLVGCPYPYDSMKPLFASFKSGGPLAHRKSQ